MSFCGASKQNDRGDLLRATPILTRKDPEEIFKMKFDEPTLPNV